MISLGEFVRGYPTQAAAAKALGFPILTLGRWLRRNTTPSKMAQEKMAKIGVRWNADDLIVTRKIGPGYSVGGTD